MATVITINGSIVACKDAVPRRLSLPLGRVPTFVFESPGGALPAGAYPYLNDPIEVDIEGVTRFAGDVVRCELRWSDTFGWTRVYTCLGLRHRGDQIRHVDDQTGTDTSIYNAPREAIQQDEYRADRAGLEVGEIITDVLTGTTNAAALDALGIGAYTTLSPPTLPTATVNDLAALDRILPGPLRFGGEKLLTVLEGFLSQNAPNHRMVVEPDGTLRFFDLTSLPTSDTLTLGTDPVQPPELTRDLSECYSAVEVYGQPIARAFEFRLSLGGLSEDPFAYDGLTVAQAKAAFSPRHFTTPDSVDEGTCTMSSTTSVTVTSSDTSRTWAADYWNQQSGKRYGSIHLTYTLGTTITTHHQEFISDCTALTAGGTSTITLAAAAPNTLYNRYSIRARRGGKLNVYTTYGLPTWAGPRATRQTSFPYPFAGASGTGVQMTTTALGLVLWSKTGSAPFEERPSIIEVDPDAGTISFPTPTYILAGNREPSDVRAFVPIWMAENYVRKPSSSYEGTGYTVDGVERVLQLFVPSWRDPANLTGMSSYAQDVLDTVKTPIVEGVLVYEGLYEDALAAGLKLNIDANDYTTGWESAALPVVDVTLEWNGPADPLTYRTTMQLSTRRAHYTESAYLAPDRTGAVLDFGLSGPVDFSAMAGNATQVTGATLGNLFNLHNNMLADRNATASGIVGNLDADVAGTLAAQGMGAAGAFREAFQGAAQANDEAAMRAAEAIRIP